MELFCNMYNNVGMDPLPYFKEPPESPESTPELFAEYPLVLTCGGRSFEFFHSEHRQLPTMREFHPDPLIMVSPEDCKRFGVRDGAWIWVENSRGARFKQKVKETIEVMPGRVHAEHGWWFPEGDPEKFFDVFEYNINNLMVYSPGKSGFGSNYKTSICRLYKLEDGE